MSWLNKRLNVIQNTVDLVLSFSSFILYSFLSDFHAKCANKFKTRESEEEAESGKRGEQRRMKDGEKQSVRGRNRVTLIDSIMREVMNNINKETRKREVSEQ